jgi:hypothetical protein
MRAFFAFPQQDLIECSLGGGGLHRKWRGIIIALSPQERLAIPRSFRIGPMADEFELFNSEFETCVRRIGGGKIGFDIDCLRALVRKYRLGAERWVQVHLMAAASQPGYLQPAVIVAGAIQVEFGDDSLYRQVVERANELGTDTLTRITRVAEPGKARRDAAREWWKRTQKQTAMCDGCGDGLKPDEGYLISGRRVVLGDKTVNLCEELLCEQCFERSQGWIER